MPHDSHFLKRNLILNIISHLGPISRTELINLTDYRPASVSAIIKELLDERLIVETGLTSGGCGRKRVRDWTAIKTAIKNDLSGYLFKTTKRNPMILPVIMEI